MKDKFNVRGYIKIESLDKNGKVIDTYEHHNLIVNGARNTFAKLLAGITTQPTINCFRMGTKGHVDTDILTPKDSTTGFDVTRQDLFSGSDAGDKNVTFNELKFTPSGNLQQTAAINVTDGADNLSTVNIQVTGLELNEPTVTYTFNVAMSAFNGLNNGMVYTECGLFADDLLMAMRCFPGRVKDSTVSLRITWNIIF